MTSMRFTMLPVGQGSGTLIQVLDNAKKPVSAVLMDLGSKGWRENKTGVVSAEFVRDELKKMDVPTLDAVFLSHGDVDHINLVKRLTGYFSPPSKGAATKDTLVVENVWFGGRQAAYKKNGKNAITILKEYRPKNTDTNVQLLGPDLGVMQKPMYAVNGVNVYVLAANTLAAETYVNDESIYALKKTSGGYLYNVVSLVLIVAYGTVKPQYFVVTADATGITLAKCNQILRKLKVPAALGVSVPHHGSANTTYDVLGAETATKNRDEYSQEIVSEFVNHLKPRSVLVSSGEVKKFKLPSARVIMDFAKHVDNSPWADGALKGKTNPGQHFYTAYFPRHHLEVTNNNVNETNWPKSNGWKTARTHKAVYSTDYFKDDPAKDNVPAAFANDVTLGPPNAPYNPPPPWGYGWVYEIPEDGNDPTIRPMLDLRTLTAAQRAAIEQRHGPLGPGPFVMVPSALPAQETPQPGPGTARITMPSRAARPGRRRARPLP